MTSRARTLSAVALCMVLAAAGRDDLLALPGAQNAPEPIEVGTRFRHVRAGCPPDPDIGGRRARAVACRRGGRGSGDRLCP